MSLVCACSGGSSAVPKDGGAEALEATTLDANVSPPCVGTHSSILATDQSIRGLATSVDRVFWSTATGAIRSVAKTGGTVETLVTMPGARIRCLVTDGARLFFQSGDPATVPDALMTVPLIGSESPRTVLDATNFGNGCAVPHAGEVFYVQYTDAPLRALLSTTSDGRTTHVVRAGLSGDVYVGAVDESNVYLYNSASDAVGAIRWIGRYGGGEEVVASGLAGQISLAVDTSKVFWGSNNQVQGRAIVGGTVTTLLSLPAGSGPVSIVSMGPKLFATPLAADADVVSLDKDSGTAAILVTNQSRPFAIAADENAVFWATLGADDGRGMIGKVCHH